MEARWNARANETNDGDDSDDSDDSDSDARDAPPSPEDAFTALLREAQMKQSNGANARASASESESKWESESTPPAVGVTFDEGDRELPSEAGERHAGRAVGGVILLVSTAGLVAVVMQARRQTGAASSLAMGASSFKRPNGASGARASGGEVAYRALGNVDPDPPAPGSEREGKGSSALFGDSRRSKRKKGKKGGRLTTKEEDDFYGL